MNTCKSCLHFDSVPSTPPAKGLCRFNPPVVGTYENYDPGTGWWPIVHISDWCAKHEVNPSLDRTDTPKEEQ